MNLASYKEFLTGGAISIKLCVALQSEIDSSLSLFLSTNFELLTRIAREFNMYRLMTIMIVDIDCVLKLCNSLSS